MLLNAEKRACDEVRDLSARVHRLQVGIIEFLTFSNRCSACSHTIVCRLVWIQFRVQRKFVRYLILFSFLPFPITGATYGIQHVIWLYDLISSWALQEARGAERRKQEEHIKQVEVCLISSSPLCCWLIFV